jgi:hypothetical protein
MLMAQAFLVDEDVHAAGLVVQVTRVRRVGWPSRLNSRSILSHAEAGR